MFRALLIVTALIAYGCLYPFRFHSLPPGGWDLFWHAWPSSLERSTARDGLINVLLYLPFGALAFLAFRRTRELWLRLLLPLFLALCLSTTIEFLQLMDLGRNSSVFDVACNVTGAAIGVAAAGRYADPLLHIVTRTQHGLAPSPTPPILLFYVWLAYQLFPLFPSTGLFAIRAKVNIFYAQNLSLSEAFLAIVEWLVIATLLRKLLAAEKSRRWLLLFLLLLPARVFLLGRRVTPSELLGAVLACAIWYYWLSRAPRMSWILSALMLAALLLLELAPFRFSAIPQPFSWIPLAGFIETGPDWGAVVFLKKSFWYGSTVWTLAATGAGYLWSALGIALLLGVLEWAQRYLPGRTPEITEPVLALLLGLLLYLFQQTSRSLEYRPTHHDT